MRYKYIRSSFRPTKSSNAFKIPMRYKDISQFRPVISCHKTFKIPIRYKYEDVQTPLGLVYKL